jgi:hypothetical protein
MAYQTKATVFLSYLLTFLRIIYAALYVLYYITKYIIYQTLQGQDLVNTENVLAV